MKRICPYFVLLFCGWCGTATAADHTLWETREQRLERRIATLEMLAERIATKLFEPPKTMKGPAEGVPKPLLSTPEVTYGWLTKTRQVFAGNQKYCQIINGRRYCYTVPTYRTEAYREWGPVASSQKVLPPEAASTPMADVVYALSLLKPQANETLVDFGCGGDARVLIEAVKRYGCKAIGFEIDAGRAESAKRAAEASGYGSRIRIIHGDANDYVIEADVGYAYLYPDDLERLVPKIKKLKRFASYRHRVKGLSMNADHGVYVWVRPQPVTNRQFVPRRYAVWNGRYYSGPLCNSKSCRMCAAIRASLGY